MENNVFSRQNVLANRGFSTMDPVKLLDLEEDMDCIITKFFNFSILEEISRNNNFNNILNVQINNSLFLLEKEIYLLYNKIKYNYNLEELNLYDLRIIKKIFIYINENRYVHTYINY